jgi:urease accessory protein
VGAIAGDAGWRGLLELSFVEGAGCTRLSYRHAIAPYKIQRSFQNPDGSCQVVMLHTAGGMVGGDRLVTKVSLAPQARVLLTTAAAAKIYRANGQSTEQRVEIDLAAGACLEWLPQETILFDQAEFRQNLRINLAPTAQVMLWEITRLGRTAHGERFVQGNWRSQTEIWQGETPLWLDRQWLPASEALWQSPHGLAGCPIVGTFAWVGQSVTPELIQQIRALWLNDRDSSDRDSSDRRFTRSFQTPSAPSRTLAQVGVTRLSCGLVCRYRGHFTTEVRQWFIQVWQLLRQQQGLTQALPRVWML